MSQPIALYLASQSPRRRELLKQIGVEFAVVNVDVPEQHQSHESPFEYVCRLASSKAEAGAQLQADQPVLGADTIVVIGERILEKPSNAEHATEMLALLSAKTHQVMTAVSLNKNGHSKTICVSTDVQFRGITEQEIADYWLSGEPQGKAGAYAIQGFGAVFVESIRGSYSNVVGLPLFEVQQLLQEFGVPIWQGGAA